MNVKVECQHISAGVNRVVNGLDWGANGLVAFGAHNAVALFDVQTKRMCATLTGHTDKVTCVKWIPSRLSMPSAAATIGSWALLASGSSDSSTIIWGVQVKNGDCDWKQQARLMAGPLGAAEHLPDSGAERLRGHAAPITGVAVYEVPDGAPGSFLLASVGGDGRVVIWHCADLDDCTSHGNQEQWSLVQEITLGTAIQNCVDLTHIPGHPEWLVMALGGVDSSVRIMIKPPGKHFEHACILRGHENWVRGVSFVHTLRQDGSFELLLATAAQDRNVRVWSLVQQRTAATDADRKRAQTAFLTSFAHKLSFKAADMVLEASISAVLVGHEDWVHSVAWQPAAARRAGHRPPRLLTASMDRSMMLWDIDPATGLWMCTESVGDAGADALGYYGGVFSPDGTCILAHGYTGALHLWQRDDRAAARGTAPLVPVPSHSGHWGEVVDACWGVDGDCVVTASTDQTVRVTAAVDGRWYEIARPQVHGHNFTGVVSVPRRQRWDYMLASCSEEKVVRLFQAPSAFVRTLAHARGATAPEGLAELDGPLGAAVGALGLSNKAVFAGDAAAGEEAANGGGGGYEHGPDLAPRAAPSVLSGQPLEEALSQSTLWPETHKLYGHGNDVYTMAACPLGSCIVSACKAQSAASAQLFVWDCADADYRLCQQLPGHTLTATQLAFTRDGRFLLTVSRDRSFCVFRALHHGKDGEQPQYELVGRKERAHDRIIWTTAWSHDSRLLATGSRDKVLRLWSFDPSNPALPRSPAATFAGMPDAVTSVAFAPRRAGPSQDGHLLAVGCANGDLALWQVNGAQGAVSAETVWCARGSHRHCANVRAIRWNLMLDGSLKMATCGSDHALRIFSVSTG